MRMPRKEDGMKPMIDRRTLLAATAAASLLTLPTALCAKSGVKRTVRWIVPFPAGGGADVLARTVAEAVERRADIRILIDNRPGAGGNVGTRQLVQAKPDGTTLGYVTNGIMAVNEHLYGPAGFDVTKDLVPTALSSEIGLVAVLNPSMIPSVTDLPSLIDFARKNPNRVEFASSGNGTTSHLAGLCFEKVAGIRLTHIPYAGGAAAMLDVLAGRVPFMIDVAPNALRHAASGKLKALATPSAQRLPSAPDVPTFAELGIPGFVLNAWDGFVLPKGTPREEVERWNQIITDALTDDKVRKRLAKSGAVAKPGTAQAFTDYITAERPKWASLVRAIEAANV